MSNKKEESFIFNHIAGIPLFLLVFISFSYSINKMFNIPMFRIDDQLAVSYKVLLDCFYNIKFPVFVLLIIISFITLILSYIYKKTGTKKRKQIIKSMNKITSYFSSNIRVTVILIFITILLVFASAMSFPILQNQVNGLDPLVMAFIPLIALPCMYIKIHNIIKTKNESLTYSSFLGLLVLVIICWNMLVGMSYYRIKVKNSPLIGNQGYRIVSLAERQFSLSCSIGTKGNVYKYLMDSSSSKPILISKANKLVVDWICDGKKPDISNFEFL